MLFESGSVVGDSRFTAVLNKSVCLLVFVTADIEVRAQRVRAREEYRGMSDEEIIAALKTQEKDELAKGHELYGPDYDYRDPKNYHLVLDSTKMSVSQCADEVRRLMYKHF
jgi:cytidylate kinase